MHLKDIEIKILKGNKKVKADLSVDLNQSRLSGLSQQSLRKFLVNCFCDAKRRQVESLLFLADNLKGPSFCRIFSKIAAQEIFRCVQTKKNKHLRKVFFAAKSESVRKVLDKNISAYLNHLKEKSGPFLTVDGIVFYKKGIVLVKRLNPPLGWALPGGFVDYGESLEEAVTREVKEETNLEFKGIKQFRAYSQSSRDPRFHTVSVVFSGRATGELKPASDALDAAIFKIKDRSILKKLPPDIAFDHKKIIKEWFNSCK